MNWDEFRKYKRLRYLYLKLKNDGGTPATSDAVTRGCVNRHLSIHYSFFFFFRIASGILYVVQIHGSGGTSVRFVCK